MSDPVYREFLYTVQDTGDSSIELMNLLSQSVKSYVSIITRDELDAIAQWFKERYTNCMDIKKVVKG